MVKFVPCSIIPFLLFSSTGFGLFPFQEICSSSCGPIQNIRPPFRLQGDPHYCGSPKYELICEGNTTILSLSSAKYYVTKLSFNPSELQVVDIGLATDKCHLPLGSLSPCTIKKDGRYEVLSTSWASFVNCTDTIENGKYRQVSCLSQSMYITSGYEVEELMPSCSFVAMIPTVNAFINKSSNTDIFQLLSMGFTISWLGSPNSFGYCLMGSLRGAEYVGNGGLYQAIGNIILLEYGFLKCVYDSKGISNLPIAITFVMVLNSLLIVLIRRLILAPLVMSAFLGYEFCRLYVSVDAIERFLRNQPPLMPKRYSYADIVCFTNRFKEKLGQGGFGFVFKGKLPGGQLAAVKLLKNSKCEGDEFINEVSTIGRIHHVNVVRLLGFCSEGSKRALIYEHMPHGSLDKYIFSSNVTSPCPFTWEKLNGIALGVARGIDYLHQGCDMRILHFDIKPHNILLDEDFNPKVADFGLAKLYPKDYSFVSVSFARGTIGYIAPEIVSRNFGVISHKSDVYSYGMLLLEIAGRRRNVNPGAENSSEMYYPSWIYDRLNQREGIKTDDTTTMSEVEKQLLNMMNDVERKLTKVGLWCIQMKPTDRPSMSKVIEMLETDGNTLPMPPKPFFSMPQSASLDRSFSDLSLSQLSTTIEEHE